MITIDESKYYNLSSGDRKQHFGDIDASGDRSSCGNHVRDRRCQPNYTGRHLTSTPQFVRYPFHSKRFYLIRKHSLHSNSFTPLIFTLYNHIVTASSIQVKPLEHTKEFIIQTLFYYSYLLGIPQSRFAAAGNCYIYIC